jgi:hypothetical protein
VKAVRVLAHRLTFHHLVLYSENYDAKVIFCWPRSPIPGKMRTFFQEWDKPVIQIEEDRWYERLHRE